MEALLHKDPLDILAYQMRTSNIAVERRLTPELPAVIADEHQLQQVFLAR